MSKILIGGMSRSGSTFLIIYLSKLGFDIGYPESIIDRYYKKNMGGLEFYRDLISLGPISVYLQGKSFPEILKHPTTFRVKEPLDTVIDIALANDLPIRQIIILQRNIDSWKASQISKRAYQYTTNNNINEEAIQVIKGLKKLKKQSSLYPHTIMEFPKFVQDFNYFYDKMSFLGIERYIMRGHWKELVDPRRIRF